MRGRALCKFHFCLATFHSHFIFNRCMCLVISYDFAGQGEDLREGNAQDVVKLESFFSSCCDCDFRSISPNALDMRQRKTLSAEGIKHIFQAGKFTKHNKC